MMSQQRDMVQADLLRGGGAASFERDRLIVIGRRLREQSRFAAFAEFRKELTDPSFWKKEIGCKGVGSDFPQAGSITGATYNPMKVAVD